MTDSCCQTTLDTSALQKHQRRVLVIVLLINTTTFAMMVISSFLSGSSSLLSGALDNFGDAVTYAISFAVVGAAAVAKARVALLKGFLIFSAAIAVGVQIVSRLMNPDVPVVETMGLAAVLNLAANLVCLRLLTPFRHGDVNMASAWECSRNDVMEGVAVILAALAVWAFDAGWPDILVATGLLVLFLRSALRVLATAWREIHAAGASCEERQGMRNEAAPIHAKIPHGLAHPLFQRPVACFPRQAPSPPGTLRIGSRSRPTERRGQRRYHRLFPTP